MAENQLNKVEVDRNNAKRLKRVMYAYVNKKPDFHQCPGQYKTRFLPDKSQMLSGTQGAAARIKTLHKHAAVIKSLTLIKSEDIKALDEPSLITAMNTPFGCT